MTRTYEAVRACAAALLAGRVLQVDGVSAGNGSVIDWRTVKCGETVQSGADAFDTAQLFVALVSNHDAVLQECGAPAIPEVHEYMRVRGARRRSFRVGPFQVYVEPHEDDDAAQADFTAALAALAAKVTP